MENNIYNIDLEIDVENKIIDADVKLSVFMNSKSDSLRFYIYKDLEIENIECNTSISYEVSKEISNWSPFIEESKLIEIKFKEQVNENDSINFNFKYKGRIDIVSKYEINRISKEWVELGLYSPWFPLFEDFRECIFNVNIDINKDYKVLNAEKVKDIYVIKNNSPSDDCTIIASNMFKEFSLNLRNTDISIYYIKESQKDISEKLFYNAYKIMKFYSEFGDIDSNRISIVNLPRSNGGGYCRKNLIVLNLNNEESEIDTFRFIAHELAHLWWHRACTSNFEDWLNESFAEFSALLAVKEVCGEEEFSKKIKLYKEESEDAPSIINLDRQDENAYEVLYRKGPVILNDLMDEVGQDKFYDILKNVYRDNIFTTDKLIEVIEKLTSRDIGGRLERKLIFK